MSEALLVGSRKARAVYWICKKVLLRNPEILDIFQKMCHENEGWMEN